MSSQVKVEEAFLNKLLQKLAERPYGEVVHLFEELKVSVTRCEAQSNESVQVSGSPDKGE